MPGAIIGREGTNGFPPSSCFLPSCSLPPGLLPEGEKALGQGTVVWVAQWNVGVQPGRPHQYQVKRGGIGPPRSWRCGALGGPTRGALGSGRGQKRGARAGALPGRAPLRCDPSLLPSPNSWAAKRGVKKKKPTTPNSRERLLRQVAPSRGFRGARGGGGGCGGSERSARLGVIPGTCQQVLLKVQSRAEQRARVRGRLGEGAGSERETPRFAPLLPRGPHTSREDAPQPVWNIPHPLRSCVQPPTIPGVLHPLSPVRWQLSGLLGRGQVELWSNHGWLVGAGQVGTNVAPVANAPWVTRGWWLAPRSVGRCGIVRWLGRDSAPSRSSLHWLLPSRLGHPPTTSANAWGVSTVPLLLPAFLPWVLSNSWPRWDGPQNAHVPARERVHICALLHPKGWSPSNAQLPSLDPPPRLSLLLRFPPSLTT